MTNAYDNAFPQHPDLAVQMGLTKREFFAAMAIASGSTVKDAVFKADELIKELNREK